MMKIRNYLSIFVCSLIATFVLAANTDAGYLYYEDFSGYADGEQPTGWVSATDIEVQNNVLVCTGGNSRFGTWYVDEDFGYPISISVDIMNTGNWGSSVGGGILFGWDEDREEGDTRYWVGLTQNSETFSISRDNEQWSNHRTRHRDSDNPLESNKWYTIEVDYDGENIVARLFDRDSGDLVRNELSWGGAQALNGQIGLSFGTSAYQYDNISIIPEPSTLVLLGLGGLLLLKRRRI